MTGTPPPPAPGDDVAHLFSYDSFAHFNVDLENTPIPHPARPSLAVVRQRPGADPAPSGREAQDWVHDPVVSARGVVKTYRTGRVEVPALRGVDLDIGAGEFVAITGPSGNGKSTLLNCLSGLDDIDEGAVFVDGQELARLDASERAAHRAARMGFVFQGFNLIGVLDARENVELPLLTRGVEPREARRRADAMLARVGLAERGGHRPAELSGGQQQRVAIARALVGDPAVVWADEPTGNLDTSTARSVAELFGEVNAAGRTLVMVTHDPEMAALADRTVVVVDGRIDGGTAAADARRRA